MSLAASFFAPDFDAQTFAFALHALGFPDAPSAEKLLRSLAKTDDEKQALESVFDELLEDLSRSADPPRALLNLSNVCDRTIEKPAFFKRLHIDERARRRLMLLLSWSQSLSDAVIRDAANLELVFQGAEAISRPQLRELAANCADLDSLRRLRKQQFLRIGLLDLERDTWRDARDFTLVVNQISDLAQVVIQRALELVDERRGEGFAVILMGKGGARELNYSSDVDLIFLSENRADAREVGEKLLRALGDTSASGQLWRADVRLRPDGGNGPLVTPFSYALSYYESFAGAWEWQALIKARVVAGDARLGRRFRKFTRQIVWARRSSDDHLREVWEMKRRSEKTPDGSDARNVKSGPGGIRDAEWIVQQLQMMIGPTHPRARAKSTLRALEVLDELDALSPDETRVLREGYLWLRVAEHRLQLWQEQPIRVLPDKLEDKAALARRLGCAWRQSAAARFVDEENARVRVDVRDLTERLFWAFFAGETREIETAIPTQFRSKETISRLERLAQGTQTRPLPAPLSRQIRAALPGALNGLERAANSQKALVNFENLCEASGNRLSLLRSLDASPRLSQAIWTILGGSQTLSDTLIRSPQLLDLAANRTLLERPRRADEARAECRAYCLAFRDRRAALRRWRGRELLRIGLRDLLLDASPHEITAEIALLAGACLDLATGEAGAQLRPASQEIAFCVLGLGKFGGVEMHPNSDCDVMFVADAFTPNSGGIAVKWAEQVIAYLGERTVDGPGWALDARLRPYGSSGALASTIEALREYFENPKSGFAAWERQALTRARIAAGDFATGARAMALVQNVAFPSAWNPNWSDELRHIKRRVEVERAGKTKDVFDVKLGVGALADIEWSAQWTAMKFGARFESLQTPSTRLQLRAARDAELFAESEFGAVDEAYTWLRRAEVRLQIAREGASGAVKRDSSDFAIWARAVFPALEESEAVARFESEWKEHTSRAREVFERVRDAL